MLITFEYPVERLFFILVVFICSFEVLFICCLLELDDAVYMRNFTVVVVGGGVAARFFFCLLADNWKKANVRSSKLIVLHDIMENCAVKAFMVYIVICLGMLISCPGTSYVFGN